MNAGGDFLGCGYALASEEQTNDDLARTVDTTDAWIVRRTGIRRRYFLHGESLLDLCTRAGERCLQKARISPDLVDMVVVATTTPDQVFPSMSCLVQRKLQISRAFGMDVAAACTGFVYALDLAETYMRARRANMCLVIGADAMSRVLNRGDRSTYVLFGDGAGAVLLGRDGRNSVLDSILGCDVSGTDSLYVEDHWKGTGHIHMQGKSVFKESIFLMTEGLRALLRRHQLVAGDLDAILPHQANLRIMQAIARHLDVPMDKFISTVDRHANVSAASIPVALSIAVQEGRLQKGDLVGITAMGAGYTWGANLIKL